MVQDDELARLSRDLPDRFLRARVTCRPVYLRKERRPGWSAALPLYALWCEECGTFTVTHPAGYGRIGCRGCRRAVRVMTWRRFRDKHLVPGVRAAAIIAAIALAVALFLR